MSKSRLLGLQQRMAWIAAWEACGKEPFAHPDYLATFLGEDETAYCFHYSSDGGEAIMPIIVREIPGSREASGRLLYDAVSPYGYGGPYDSGSGVRDESAFWSQLRITLLDLGIVSFFGRLALDFSIAKSSRDIPHDISVVSQNIAVSLAMGEQERWMSYDHKVRKNVKKALRSGLTVTISSRHTKVEEFAALYEATMTRRQAADRYMFTVEFFKRLETLPSECHLVAEVRDPDGVLASAEVVLCSENRLYSFLGGTHSAWFDKRPNDLLKHHVILHGSTIEMEEYVLGGGYAPDDGIFRYKRSFEPSGVVDFCATRMIIDNVSYSELAAARLSSGNESHGNGAFFPAYRA